MSTKPPQKHACTCDVVTVPSWEGLGGKTPGDTLVSLTPVRREEFLDIKRYFLYYGTAFVTVAILSQLGLTYYVSVYLTRSGTVMLESRPVHIGPLVSRSLSQRRLPMSAVA